MIIIIKISVPLFYVHKLAIRDISNYQLEAHKQKNMQQLPTDSELEVLQILWQNGAQTVRFVNDEQNKQREVGYTTTLKIMQIMLDKAMLSREIVERSHIYTTKISEESTQKELLKDFSKNAFRGDTASLVMRALGEGNATAEELAEIKALIEPLLNPPLTGGL